MKNVLLVEDSVSDARLTEEAFRYSQSFIQLHIARDAEEALTYLKAPEHGKPAPSADLILLDLNLPTLDGRELLGEIKKDLELGHIPVVVLTASDQPGDIEICYRMGAACFLHKPHEWDPRELLVQTIIDFWLSDPPLKMNRLLPAKAVPAV